MCRITRGHAHEETQKLQPSISFLVVSGRAPKNQADNYREFPVARQWKHQLKRARTKPMQCNVPKNPWPRAKKLSHRYRCLWPLAPQRCAGNAASTQPSVPSCLGNAPLVISATMGQVMLAAGAEVAMCRITNSQGPRGNKHCCHRPLSWWSLGLSIDLCPCGRWESQ